MTEPTLRVHLEASCFNDALRSIFTAGEPDYFQVCDDADAADVIVFKRDDWSYVRRSPLFVSQPYKCIAIHEWDKPSFFLPAIYASNQTDWYARGRAETSHYMVARRIHWNQAVIESSSACRDKRFLYSYMGKSSSTVRKRIVRHYATRHAAVAPVDVWIEATDGQVLDLVDYTTANQRRYAEVMAASKYVLCPRGWGSSSMRLFEACEMGIAPVILADRWVPVSGVDWSFALFIAEQRIEEIDSIIRSHESEWVERGERARRTYLDNFADEVAPRFLHQRISRLLAQVTQTREAAIRRRYPGIFMKNWAWERRRKLLGRHFPQFDN